ncbi:hypothetical protein [Microbacterium sp. Leaf151]|uniref:hypothetical protein n=1 Tax=Microbacterium sp. Leaf151 TaxID=1736276 RepID=UPI0006F7B11F|nr:hypothetical protein [Microbacterium sp. Leaf151]KQR23174.1 hypothetical protein ASF76_08080 [Microbacterium sp. Leaf151]
MPDISGARRLFTLTGAQADQYDQTAHEAAWVLASAASRSIDQLDTELDAMLALLEPVVGERGPDEAHAALALVARRLALFVRSLTTGNSASTHPLADNLRRHEDLSGVQGEQLVARLETWLRSNGGRA